MKPEHTPGEWSCDLSDIGIMDSMTPYVAVDDGYRTIARIPINTPHGAADACLITMAPKLLRQLEFAVKLLGGFPMLNATAQVDSMRETIAKARAHG